MAVYKQRSRELIALKNGVYSNQYYVADADENNLTYNVTLPTDQQRTSMLSYLFHKFQTSGC